jgi:hypothetical protein
MSRGSVKAKFKHFVPRLDASPVSAAACRNL